MHAACEVPDEVPFRHMARHSGAIQVQAQKFINRSYNSLAKMPKRPIVSGWRTQLRAIAPWGEIMQGLMSRAGVTPASFTFGIGCSFRSLLARRPF